MKLVPDDFHSAKFSLGFSALFNLRTRRTGCLVCVCLWLLLGLRQRLYLHVPPLYFTFGNVLLSTLIVVLQINFDQMGACVLPP